ncbi:phage minor head protein [Neomegalonema sp.]|uniref:phage head morphogenesis protein n=1 Tax=Neomegalonema sp. TaxID=2039713 RepID=UPI0026077D77|nr:phage minor head protein [Neomegalonema sp.]MDD2870094.1 phage minor head protein [Neomegalonema sp.]
MSGIDLKPLPPQETIEAFARKGLRASFDWRDMEREEHSRAFTVAKLMQLDLLAEIREAISAAITEGMTLQEFRKTLTPVLQAGGWWGRQTMTDPQTGETREVQLGSPRRLEIIYDTNLRMAHAAGRWERIEEVASNRPWLRYVAVLDGRTRPAHRSWHGVVLPWDDPWWGQHAPPNGWRCRCSIQQLSDRDLARRGLRPSDAPRVETRDWVNGRTGEVRSIPKGVDPGFDYNVGRANLDHLRATTIGRLDVVDDDLARAAVAAHLQGGAFASFWRSPDGRAGFPVALGGARLGADFSTIVLPPQVARALAADKAAPAPEDWLLVQKMVDAAPELVDQGPTMRLMGAEHALDLEIDAAGRVVVSSLRKISP